MLVNQNDAKIAMSISPAQCRAARGLIGWSQDQLVSALAGEVSKRTVVRFERDETSPQTTTLDAIQRALEAAGVIFIAESEEGPGVRLKRSSENLSSG